MRQAAAECWMYCDPENYDLKTALAQELGLSPANIVVGEGIDSLFGYTVRMFTEPGDAVVSSLGAYPTFNFHVAGYGGRLVTAPYVDEREDRWTPCSCSTKPISSSHPQGLRRVSTSGGPT